MNENDMFWLAHYYSQKELAASAYGMAIRGQNHLDTCLYSLFLWQDAIDEQNIAWSKINESKRINAVLVSSGFTG